MYSQEEQIKDPPGPGSGSAFSVISAAPYRPLHSTPNWTLVPPEGAACFLAGSTQNVPYALTPLPFPPELLGAPLPNLQQAPSVKQANWKMSEKATLTRPITLSPGFPRFPLLPASTYHSHHRPRVHVLHQPRVEGAVFQVNVVLLQKFLGGLPPQKGYQLVTTLGRKAPSPSQDLDMVANLASQPAFIRCGYYF